MPVRPVEGVVVELRWRLVGAGAGVLNHPGQAAGPEQTMRCRLVRQLKCLLLVLVLIARPHD